MSHPYESLLPDPPTPAPLDGAWGAQATHSFDPLDAPTGDDFDEPSSAAAAPLRARFADPPRLTEAVIPTDVDDFYDPEVHISRDSHVYNPSMMMGAGGGSPGGEGQPSPTSPTNSEMQRSPSSRGAAFRKFRDNLGRRRSVPAAHSREAELLRHALSTRRNIGSDYEDQQRDLKFSIITLFTVALSWGGFLMICITQLVFADIHGNTFESDAASKVMQILISISTALCIVLIIVYYHSVGADQARSAQVEDGDASDTPWWRTRRGLYCLTEILVHLPHPVPWVHYRTPALAVVMIGRLYLVGRLTKFFSDAFILRFDILSNARTTVGRYLVIVNSALCMRVLFYRRSGMFFVVFFALTLLPMAAVVMIAERDENLAFDKYRNCLWYIFITFSTVGYGDMFPVSALGRIVAVAAAMAGLLGANLFAAMLVNQLAPTPAQDRILEFLNATRAREAYDETRIRYIQVLVRQWYIKRQLCRMYYANRAFPLAITKFKETIVIQRLHEMRDARAEVQKHPDRPTHDNHGLEEAVIEVATQCRLLQTKIVRITQNTIDSQKCKTGERRIREAAKEVERKEREVERMEERQEMDAEFEDVVKKIEELAEVARAANSGTCAGSMRTFQNWSEDQERHRERHEEEVEAVSRQFEESTERMQEQQEAELQRKLDGVQKMKAEQWATQQAIMAQRHQALNDLAKQQADHQQHLDRLQAQLIAFVNTHKDTASRATSHQNQGVDELRTRVEATMQQIATLNTSLQHQREATEKFAQDFFEGIQPLQEGIASAATNINDVKDLNEIARQDLKNVDESIAELTPLAEIVNETRAEVHKLMRANNTRSTGFEDVRKKLNTVVHAVSDQNSWGNLEPHTTHERPARERSSSRVNTTAPPESSARVTLPARERSTSRVSATSPPGPSRS